MNIKFYTISLIVVMVLAYLPAFADNWEFVHEKKDIKVFRKYKVLAPKKQN